MLSKIISGGQTGADRAALDAGLELGFPIGGTCPVGRKAEDGPISSAYSLKEIGGYRQRTRQNVIDSDGTVIFYESYVQSGTQTTLLFCIRQGKPYKLIDIEVVNTHTAADLVTNFVSEFDVNILNVAGPRLSGCPGIYDYVKETMAFAIQRPRGMPNQLGIDRGK